MIDKRIEIFDMEWSVKSGPAKQDDVRFALVLKGTKEERMQSAMYGYRFRASDR
jgi:hypothetical protein